MKTVQWVMKWFPVGIAIVNTIGTLATCAAAIISPSVELASAAGFSGLLTALTWLMCK